MSNFKLTSGLLVLTLAGMTSQAAAPSLSYEVNGNEFIINYTGTLYQSDDAVSWTAVASASSPYKVQIGNNQQFFCAKASDEPIDPLSPGKNGRISLPGGVSLDMNWIKPGTFMMGSPEDELGAGGDETQHQVTLTKGYWIGKYEVTQAQYEAVIGENPSRFKGGDLPVEMVSWVDATNFCARLTEIEKAAGRLPGGYEYTLPTEAQWEYACRAGTTTAFNNGTNIETIEQLEDEPCPNLDPVGWYWCNSGSKTHPVGQKQPNAWGLYDMHGNVIEWCLDAKGRYPVTPVVDPVGENTEPYRAVRGGSYSYYDDSAKGCRSAERNSRLNTATSDSLGFRVALAQNVIERQTLTITINDTKLYDGTPLVSGYTKATVTGLLDGDKLTAGAATSAKADVGSYSYPLTSAITTPFATAMGIDNYTVTYVINQSITKAPLTITINDTKAYDGTPLVSGYTKATVTGLMAGDKLTAGAATSAKADVGSYSYPQTSAITTPFATAYGIGNYAVTYVISQKIIQSDHRNKTIPLSGTVNLDMIWIKPGTFTMGSPSGEQGRFDDETQHQVTLTQEYWLGKYEVTQAQYEAVMGTNPSLFKGADLPVDWVNWNDATNFCAKLTARERAAGRLPKGYEYTLPTEAQWEYACRAGTTTALNSGKNLSDIQNQCPEMDEVGWYKYDSDKMTHPAGQKQPNDWGLYDMHGNVWEWCLDWYGSYPSSAVTDPTGAVTGSNRVMRGGCWDSYAYSCRSAKRGSDKPGYTYINLGFRVALTRTKDMTIPLLGGVDLDMIWIEPGTFMMGSSEYEVGREDNEIQHQVTLTQGYWLGQYEVTQAQYKAVMGKNPSDFKGADLPVEQVSWDDAMEFCKELTAIERAAGRLPKGYEYTLPTEAQWEYACRAGTTTALNSGKNLSAKYECPEMDEVGWYGYNSGAFDSDGNWTDNGKIFPVGQKQPNAWGLYDMHGNVNEWCLDWYGSYPSSAVADPKGPATGSGRVVRGGSWGTYAYSCRSAHRFNYYPDFTNDYYGFRVALAPENKDMTIPLSGTVNLDMIWIEPGTFTMGSPSYELGRYDREMQHQVTLTQGYWLGKYEVTQAQYEAVMGTNPSRFKGADLPVEMVSWVDATNFCAKLTAIERAAGRLPNGYEYTLPTEAQWEYACRSGTTTAFNNGTNIEKESQIEGKCPNLDEVGWYDGNSGSKTHPVGQKQPNAWGLYDMHGNVLEWCLDWYGSYPSSAGTDPKGVSTGSDRVLRGGSWYNYAGYCRSAYRFSYAPGYGSIYYGFRVALAPVK